jgi:exosortase family protein XrtM
MTKVRSSKKLATPRPPLEARRWLIYIVPFLIIFVAFDYGYYVTRGTWVEHLIVDTLTVRPAAIVINTVVPKASVTAHGNDLSTPYGRISVLQGCEGTEAIFLLIAAIVPFPTAWKTKLLGIGAGIVLVYAMNQLRLLALVVSLLWHREWFSSLHGIIAPTFIVLAGCLFFLVWANIASPRVQA